MALKEGNYSYRYYSGRAATDTDRNNDFYIIEYFENITGYCIVNENRYDISSGDIVVVNPYEEYSVIANNESCIIHTIHFTKQYLDFLGVDILYHINKKPVGKLNVTELTYPVKKRIYDCFNRIKYYKNNRLLESEVMIKTYIIQIIVGINEFYKNKMYDKAIYTPSNKKINAVIEYINNNIKHKISLDVIAEKFYISKYHLCHSFKSTTGYTIHNYINMQKTEVAKELLNSGMTPSEVAFECGFTEYSVFYKSFKKYTGKTPTQYIMG